MSHSHSTTTSDFIPFAVPSIGNEEIDEVCDSLRSGWVTSGPKTKRFEGEFAEYVDAKHAIAVNSATAGLHLALEAIGVGPGDRVFTTPYTFTATAEVIRYLGADPVFVDIDPQTRNMDPIHLADAIGKHPGAKAIMPVHFAGQACDMTPILSLARQNGLAVIEDAAHALPTTYSGKKIGSIGDITVFSFYATKTITTGEGGMITTDDAKLAHRMRLMRLHGIDRDVFDRYTSPRAAWYYEVVAPGFKYNMTDVAASIGIHQLRKAEDFRARREAIALCYTEAFRDLPVVLPFVSRLEDTHAWHLYTVQIKGDAQVGRDDFIEALRLAGIGTSVHFIPLHMQPYWRDRYQLRCDSFPVATQVYEGTVSLPIYPSMSDAMVERVISAVRRALKAEIEPAVRRAA